MKSFKVHACSADTNGRIPYVIVSLCGRERVSIDMAGLQSNAAKANDAIALSMNALYDLLQGKRLKVDRDHGAIDFIPTDQWIVIQKEGTEKSHKVWMAELALAWNMLAGYDATPISTRWNTQ